MTEEQKQREAEAIEMMHEQWAAPVAGADDDDEPMTWDAPTPAADELARLRARVAELEAQLKAVESGEVKLVMQLAEWQEAFGLLTTLAPIEIDAADPISMARDIACYVLEAQRAVQP